jgi:hypothetical protein
MARRRFPLPEIVKILMMITCLVAIIVTKDSCGQAVKNLFNTVAPPVAEDAGGYNRR